MSSKAKKLSKDIKTNNNMDLFDLYHSTIGTIVCTVCKLLGKSNEQALSIFRGLRSDPKTVEGRSAEQIFNYLWEVYSDKELDAEVKEMIAFIYDADNIRSPAVTIMDEDGVLLPISPDGSDFGIIRDYNVALKKAIHEGALFPNNIIVEPLLEEEDEDN